LYNARNELIRAAGQLYLFVMQTLRDLDAAQLHPAISRNLAFFAFFGPRCCLVTSCPVRGVLLKHTDLHFYSEFAAYPRPAPQESTQFFSHEDRCYNLHPNLLFASTDAA
jgi:hypothetical protein